MSGGLITLFTFISPPSSDTRTSRERSTWTRHKTQQSRYTPCQTAAAGVGLPALLKMVFLLCGALEFLRSSNGFGYFFQFSVGFKFYQSIHRFCCALQQINVSLQIIKISSFFYSVESLP